MRIGPIVLRIRLANTRFGNFIGGAAELDMALNGTLTGEQAFVVPIEETAVANDYDTTINQSITERFAVVTAFENDNSDADKTGLGAYDRTHEVRSEIFKAILGWQIVGAESLIYYAGGQMLNIDSAYMWYQFDFEFKTRLCNFDHFSDVAYHDDENEGEFREQTQESQLDDLLTIYANYIQWPSAELPYSGEWPINDGYPDVLLPDFAQVITRSDDPNPGAFGRGFGGGYDFYKILNRKNDPK
jgi:hypothetical protein